MKKEKIAFIGITILLWAAAGVFAFTGKITYETLLSSLGLITASVFGLYHWYTKGEIVKTNNYLREAVSDLNDRNDLLMNRLTEQIKLKEVIDAKEVKPKRKYTKKKK